MKRHFRKIIALLLIVFTFTAPSILADDLGKDICYQWLQGSSPKWTGIIHVWHVVSWQVGQSSAASWLEKRARGFEKRNAGVFVSVEGMTVEEYKKRVSEGERPDILSFGLGLIDNPQELFEAISLPDKIKSNVKKSASVYGTAYSMPYMMGAYGIYINEELVQSAGIDYLDISAGGIALADFNEVLTMLRDESKEGILPLIYGKTEYTLAPISLIYLYTGDGADQSGRLFNNAASVISEDASAYKIFVSGKAGVLLGTQKNAFDLTNESSEMAYSFSATGISIYTDMVQYLGILKTEEENKKYEEIQFLNYMLRDDIQKELKSIGVFSVVSNLQVMDEDPILSSFEQAILKDAVVPNAYTWSKMQQTFLEPLKLFLKGNSKGADTILSQLGTIDIK